MFSTQGKSKQSFPAFNYTFFYVARIIILKKTGNKTNKVLSGREGHQSFSQHSYEAVQKGLKMTTACWEQKGG